MNRLRRLRTSLAALCFVAAAGCFVQGLAGHSGSWLVAMVGALGFLTLAFFVASGPSEGDPS